MATVAKTKQDVDSMTTRERLWDSLSNAYAKKQEASDESYDKAISKVDRQALSRGMQRSSYNNQTLANLGNQKVKAQNDINSELIADYENRLQQSEEAEAARAWQSGENELARAFQTAEREAQQSWQSGENALARQFQTAEREAQQKYNTGEREATQIYNTSERESQQNWQAGQNELVRAFQTAEREAQQKYSTGEREAQQEWQAGQNELARAFQTAEREAQQKYNTGEREAQQKYQSAENALAREYQTAERLGQQEWQSGENAAARAEQARQFNENLAYNKEQAAITNALNEATLAETTRVNDLRYGEDRYQRDLAVSYVQLALANGQVPSDELLARAGLSREDAILMAAKAKSSGSGKTNKDDDTGNGNGSGVDWVTPLTIGSATSAGVSAAASGARDSLLAAHAAATGEKQKSTMATTTPAVSKSSISATAAHVAAVNAANAVANASTKDKLKKGFYTNQ